MRISRRAVMVGGASLGAISLVGGCDGPKPAGDDTGGTTPLEPWAAPGTQDDSAFAWGVQVGDATSEGAVVSLTTTEPSVLVVLARAEGTTWVEVDRSEALTPTDEALQLTLEGLDSDTEYSVAVYSADGTRRSAVTRFRTALPADGSRVVTFGATSCLGGNEPWPSLSHAAAENLDFFCLLGDTIYMDLAPDKYDLEAKWYTALSTKGLRDLTGSTSLIATWDDHEVDNNWSYETDGMEDMAADALAWFKRSLPLTAGPGGTGLWRKLSWGKVLDVFVLDCRGERRDGLYISVEQMDWLKAGLSTSTARFKIILNSVPITDYFAFWGNSQDEDRWSGYPEQRQEILSHIADNAIAGVLWISGDLHMAQVGMVDPAGGIAANQWEVLAGPAGSFPNVLADMFEGDPQYTFLSSLFNWTRFTCDPDAGTITVSFVGDDGLVFYEQVLSV